MYANIVKEKRHLRLPVYRDFSRAISYRNFEEEEVFSALNRQTKCHLIPNKSFCGEKEIVSAPQPL